MTISERHRVAQLAELPVGSLLRVDVAGEAVCLARIADGEVLAVQDRCTHEEASLSEGDVIGCEVECPQHNARFDLRTGAPAQLPAVEPVRVYPVHVEGDEIYIVSAPTRRST